jgi:hypothetical protein
VGQTIHIFRKDVRYLWLEICLFIFLTALFGWRDYEWSEVLLPVTAAFLIARLIHAETIPGDTQFWITRPYRWRNLLAAKLLFIFAFVNLPVLIARIILIDRAGFPLAFELVPLLWSQLLMIVAFCLPVAALAAVTADMATFVLSTLVLVIIGFFSNPLIGIFRRGMESVDWPEGVEWIRPGLFLAIVIITSAVLLFIQYRARHTKLSRILGMVLLLAGLLSFLSISPALATELQARLSSRPSFASEIRVEVGAMPRKFAASRREAQLSIPLDIAGIPDGLEPHFDGLSITLEAPDGRRAQAFSIPTRNSGGSGFTFDDILFVDPSFFALESKQSVKMRGVTYITVFGGPRATNVTFTHGPQNVGDGLRCYIDERSGQLHCQSAFRWPRLLIDAKVRELKEPFWPLISYSPFPAGVELNYIEDHRVSGPPPHDPQATILVMKPLAHFRTDFSVDDFHMERFAAPPVKIMRFRRGPMKV